MTPPPNRIFYDPPLTRESLLTYGSSSIGIGRDPWCFLLKRNRTKKRGYKTSLSIQNIWALFSRIRFLGLERFLSFLVKIKIISIYKNKKSFEIQ